MHAAPDIRAMPGAVLAVTAAAGAAGWGRLWLDVRLFEADVLAGVNQLEHESEQQGCKAEEGQHQERISVVVHLRRLFGGKGAVGQLLYDVGVGFVKMNDS